MYLPKNLRLLADQIETMQKNCSMEKHEKLNTALSKKVSDQKRVIKLLNAQLDAAIIDNDKKDEQIILLEKKLKRGFFVKKRLQLRLKSMSRQNELNNHYKKQYKNEILKMDKQSKKEEVQNNREKRQVKKMMRDLLKKTLKIF